MFTTRSAPPPPAAGIVCESGFFRYHFFGPDSSISLGSSLSSPDDRAGDTIALAADPAGLVLAPGEREGCYTSRVISMPAFDWLVPSWSFAVPGGTAVEVHIQVWTDKSWSIWYPLGSWSEEPRSREGKDEYGHVETDTLSMKSPHTLLRYRLCVQGAEGRSPVLREFGIVTRHSATAPGSVPTSLLPGALPDRDLELDVTPRSQMVEDASIASRICSPTCLAMAMSYFGVDLPTAQVARMCYDHGAEIYGNWSFNASTPARFGLSCRAHWFGDFGSLARELESGHPVVASVRFREGELDGAPIRGTTGHLVLVRGYIRRGGEEYVIVNDPAAPGSGSVRREYRLTQFLKAWRGVVYIVEGTDQGAGRESSALQWE